jgi:hypothetical protein
MPPQTPKSAALTPEQYLQSDATISKVKATVDSGAIDPRNLRLDPSPCEDDKTIGEYHSRVSGMLGDDRRKIHVMTPYQPIRDSFISQVSVSLR